MKFPRHLFFYVLLWLSLFGCGESNSSGDNHHTSPGLFPYPANIIAGQGRFEFDEHTVWVSDYPQIKALAKPFLKKLRTASGIAMEFRAQAPQNNYLLFKVDRSLEDEAYVLDIAKNHIEISSHGDSGFLYALESLRQLLPHAIEENRVVSKETWDVPVMKIEDAPRYPWRGLMLDVSRHFFEKEHILKTIDRMAFLKLNTLHLHLVDDQGWRMEIERYPKLTSVGGFRVDQEDKHWDARNTNRPGEHADYGGFYTKKELREIVSYADSKGISVVPEIEMPAHVSSAIAAYPELSCFGEPIGVPSGGVWPITDIYCAGKESTFEFLENVLLEVMEVFPSPYIHVGGDEATRTNWEKCGDCQHRIKKEGLKGTAALQSYFIQRMERFLSDHGRTLIGWDEILEGGLPSGATVMSWRGIQGGWEASERGHDVIMTPGTVYLNQYQGDPDHEPLAFGGYVPLNQVYAFDPVVDSMSVNQKQHILGSQANLWSEYITDGKESEYMLFPRLVALSEALWSPREQKDWKRFSNIVPRLFERLDAMGVNYAKSAYAVTAQSELEQDGKIRVSLHNELYGSEIRYVLDDGTLSAESPQYTHPIPLEETATVRAGVFKLGKMVGDTLVKEFRFHKAVGKTVQYSPAYNDRYQGIGQGTLTNVLRGSKNFHDGQWLAWLERNPTITIDLENLSEISSVTVGSMENQGSGIYFPTKVEVLLSKDGRDFKKVAEWRREHRPNGNVALANFLVSFTPQQARWIKVEVTNLSHPPTGGSCFVFLDELIVE